MTDELVINESNFTDYFFDVRTHSPKPGQIMARYSATADFIDGPLKRDVLWILQYHDGIAAPKIMKKVGCAIEKDSYRLPIEMAKDMLNGMTEEDVARKPYRYTVEVFFYTNKEHVPVDDPHWSVISILNLDEFLDAGQNKIKMTTKEVKDEVQDIPAGPEQGDGGSLEVVLEE